MYWSQYHDALGLGCKKIESHGRQLRETSLGRLLNDNDSNGSLIFEMEHVLRAMSGGWS